MSYHGDIKLGDTLDVKFTTTNTSGVPTTLAGTPVISAYVGNGTSEITAGITLTVDFDSRTGMHNVRVVATTGNGYAAATNVQLVITTGTVGGSSVVGYVVGEFSIENRVQNVASVPTLTGAYPFLGIADSGTAGAAPTSTTLQVRSGGFTWGTNAAAGMTLLAFGSTQGYWQSRPVNSNTSGTSAVFTVDAFSVTPSGTVTYVLVGSAPISSTTVLSNNFTQIAGSSAAATSLKNILTGIAGETLKASFDGSLSGSVGGNVTGSVGSVVTPVTIAGASVTAIQAGVNVGTMNGALLTGDGSPTNPIRTVNAGF